MSFATCIGCGCDDDNACLDPATGEGCSWLRLDRYAGVGVCSVCPEEVQRWDDGDRSIDEAAVDDLEDEDESRLILPGDEDFGI